MPQETAGALAQVTQPDDEIGGLAGIFSQFNRSTPEAQRFARSYLEDYQDYDFTAEEDILEQFRETAEQSRQALRETREKVLADEYDPRQKWLAAAQAFGAPTRTGSFGESLGAVAGAIREPLAEERQFGRRQDERLLELDQALAGVDQNLLMNEFKLQQLRREQAGDLAKESLRQLGRQTPQRPTDTPGMKSLDQKMATEYRDWAAGGQADVQAQQVALESAIEQLETNDNISGPWIGMLPKMARDVLMPDSANVQETIETVAQRSLKAILGGQFGQREGEMLLERTFNPRLKESTNRERAYRLMQQIVLGAKEKDRAMAWWQDHGTMLGYDGKTEWTLDDFIPDPVMRSVRMRDGKVVNFPTDWTGEEMVEYYNEMGTGLEAAEAEFAKGGRVRRRFYHGGPVSGFRHKKKSPQFRLRRRRGYQAGGDVEDIEDIINENITDIGDIDDEGFVPSDVTDLLLGAGAGAATGIAAEETGTRLYEMQQDLARPPKSEQYIGTAMDVSGVEPTDMAADVKRSRRMRVPDLPMDRSGRVTRALGERALMAAGDSGDVALEVLEERHAGSKERVARQVEAGLKTPEFTVTEQKLTERLYTRAKPLYKKAYAENPSVKMPEFYGDMLSSKYGMKAVGHALDFMEMAGKPIGRENAAGIVQRPSLEFLDQLKRGWDQMIRTEENMGPTPLGKLMRDQRRRLVRFLDNPDNVTGTYQRARQQYKGDLETLEALDVGRRQFHRMPAEEARVMINDMSWAEVNAMKTGFAQRLYDIIYNPSGDTAAARRLIGSPEMRRRMQLLFDKPAEYRVFETALEREMDLWEKGRKTIGRAERGRTSRQIGEVMAMDDPLNAAKEFISRGPIMWVLRTVGWGRRGRGLTERQADEIVDILMTKDIKELDKIAPKLEYGGRYAKTRRKRRGKAAAIGAAIGAGAMLLPGEEEEEPK